MEDILVVYAAGHYKGTAGKRLPKELDPNETREWFLNNLVAVAFEERRKMYEGFNTIRVDDPTGETAVTLEKRCQIANGKQADLFLEFHHNANQGKPWKGGGIVAYCSKGSTKSPEWRDALYDAAIEAGGIVGDRSYPKARADYYVLTHTNMRAVLMEFGFMDSIVDAPIILNPEYSRKMGYAMADGVAKKAGLKLKRAVPQFEDVPEDAWYHDAVQKVAAQGLMVGVGNNLFDPGKPVTRAELAQVLARLMEKL